MKMNDRGSSRGLQFLKAGCLVLAIFISILAAYLMTEIYYRISLKNRITSWVDHSCLWIQNQTLTISPVDDYFKRKPRMHPKGLFKIKATFDIAVLHPQNGIQNFSVRTNNIGLLSDKEYSFERNRKQPEFRIVVLGDSFTGPTTCTYQWVDTLEDLLNSSAEARKAVGNKVFRTYNLGWVGGGFGTFWKEYIQCGRFFSPDMIVVNYIDVDFPRSDKGVLFASEREMIDHARKYMVRLLGEKKEILTVLLPTHDDLLPCFSDNPRTRALMAAIPGLKVERMRDCLPVDKGPAEIESWYNVPFDAHFSDKGGEIYARALAGVIARKIAGKAVDFSKATSKFYDPKEGWPYRTRPIVNSLTPLIKRPSFLMRVKEEIKHEMIGGKVYGTLYPYVFYRVLGIGSDGIQPLYTRKMKAGFIKYMFGPNPRDVLLLNVFCASGELDLRNPECFCNLQFFTEGDSTYASTHPEEAMIHPSLETAQKKTAPKIEPPPLLEAGVMKDGVFVVEQSPFEKPMGKYALTPPGTTRIKNGDFKSWPNGEEFQIKDASMETARNWVLIADGTGGKGLAQTRLEKIAPAGGEQGLMALKWEQKVKAEKGSPSLRQILNSVNPFKKQVAVLSFYAQSNKSLGMEVLIEQSFGSFRKKGTCRIPGFSKKPSEDRVLAARYFRMSKEWSRYAIPIIFPSLNDFVLGDPGTDSLAIIFMPKQPDELFAVDFANVRFEGR